MAPGGTGGLSFYANRPGIDAFAGRGSVMNSSLHRCNAFRSLVGSALFAAFALTLGTTLAVAQQGQAVSKTTAPKAAPAPAAAP